MSIPIAAPATVGPGVGGSRPGRGRPAACRPRRGRRGSRPPARRRRAARPLPNRPPRRRSRRRARPTRGAGWPHAARPSTKAPASRSRVHLEPVPRLGPVQGPGGRRPGRASPGRPAGPVRMLTSCSGDGPSLLLFKTARIPAEKTGALLPGIDGQKMSKSYNNHIPVFIDSAARRKLVMKIVTTRSFRRNPKIRTEILSSSSTRTSPRRKKQPLCVKLSKKAAWATATPTKTVRGAGTHLRKTDADL